ncbi:MAG: AmmeMemoRadiSam system protein B [Bacteroidia bacterium]|nr:MAG: AmmeMemoRadiSam system protein B [Bacteroidia bacterium]
MRTMKNIFIILAVLTIGSIACQGPQTNIVSVRIPIDSVGFAVTAKQMDIVMSRLSWEALPATADPWKVVISPHDDYQYVSDIYPLLLQNIKSDVVILFGVAHRAASLGLEDSLVFDNFDYWSGPYGNVRVSSIREEIMSLLDPGFYTVNDSMHGMEHSLESLIPFLQYFNRDIEIVPILVPYMSPERMKIAGNKLAAAISRITEERSLSFGKDISIVITSDAVHYGNEDWGENDYAWYGCDQAGNQQAVAREYEIIENCLTGNLTEERIALFSSYTLSDDNWKEYKWSWCGRYSIPVGLYTALYIDGLSLPDGKLVAYSTSILNNHTDFTDNDMGTTAIATDCHWVGYPAIGF